MENLIRSGGSANPIMVPSSTTIVPMRTESEINRLISGLQHRFQDTNLMHKRFLETEKKKEVHSESSNSVTQDDTKTIENSVEENTEIITETISNEKNTKTLEKKTKITNKTDKSTTKDTNFTQTIVRKSHIEVVTETKISEDYFVH